MNFKELPKIELHIHLDCSLSFQVVQKLDPGISQEVYRRDFIAPPKCPDLVDFLTRAVRGVELMQTVEQLQLVTLDLFEQFRADRVIYAEIRFAPLLHTRGGLTAEEVVEAVDQAVVQGVRNTGIEAGLLLCTLRHFSVAESLQTVRLVDRFKGRRVVGFDIAADEAGFPVDAHIAAFQYARLHGIPCTAHAGEARGPDSVWETLQQLAPSRIGHGVRSAEDEKLLAYLKEKSIHLEVCPTSNLQTSIYETMADHSADLIFRSGVPMSINTDGRTISAITLADEYHSLHRYFNWGPAHFKQCNLQAIEAAFTTEQIKKQLRQQIIDQYR